MPDTDQQAAPTCPPHRWLIESQYQTGGNMETWTCGQCGEVRSVDRRSLNQQPRPFTAGGRKPPADAPTEQPPATEAAED